LVWDNWSFRRCSIQDFLFSVKPLNLKIHSNKLRFFIKKHDCIFNLNRGIVRLLKIHKLEFIIQPKDFPLKSEKILKNVYYLADLKNNIKFCIK